MKLNFNNDRNSRKPTNVWKLKRSIVNDYWFEAEINKEIKDFLQLSDFLEWKWTHNMPKHTRYSESSAKGKVQSTECLHKEFREISH